jgi:very-short-patch-repair endonuclease
MLNGKWCRIYSSIPCGKYVILEVDGVWSHNYPDGREIDYIRNQELEDIGYRVLRFWEGQFDAQSVWREI